MKTVLTVLFLVGLAMLAFGNYSNVENFETDKTMKKNIDKAHKLAGSLEHYDEDYDDNYEDFENEAYESEFLEHAERMKRKGIAPTRARQAAYAKMTAKYGQKFKQAIEKQSKKGGSAFVGKNPFYDASAMFDLNILRKSVNIALALPVPLFAAVHYDAKYRGIINQYLPSDVTITAITLNSSGSVVFTYTSGVLTDNIEVSCTQVPYITFLSASQFNAMKISKFRYQLSDATQLTQFNQTFDVVEKTLFGKSESNQVSVGAYKSPDQYQSGIIDIDNPIDVNLEKGLVVGLIAVDEFSVTLSCFVQKYNRTNTRA